MTTPSDVIYEEEREEYKESTWPIINGLRIIKLNSVRFIYKLISRRIIKYGLLSMAQKLGTLAKDSNNIMLENAKRMTRQVRRMENSRIRITVIWNRRLRNAEISIVKPIQRNYFDWLFAWINKVDYDWSNDWSYEKFNRFCFPWKDRWNFKGDTLNRLILSHALYRFILGVRAMTKLFEKWFIGAC